MTILILLFILTISSVFSRSAQEWQSRTIYQIITDRFAKGDGNKPSCDLNSQPNYCGGDFFGIINNLDYIQGMGFNAIWISPIPQNVEHAFHGYAAQDLSKINSHYGGEQGLKKLIESCHKKDIWVMVDVVANHMGNTDLDFSKNIPFNLPEHYHEYCLISDNDFATKNMKNIQNCRLSGLADLNTENPFVANYLFQWIKNLIQTYNIDGIRIDTVPEVSPKFWKQYTESAGVFAVGEVFDPSYSYVGGYVSSVGSVLNYPWYFTVKDIFLYQKDMLGIRDHYQNWQRQNIDVSILAQFIDNHDNPRFLSYSHLDQNSLKTLLKAYTTLTLTTIGVPIMYYGTEQYFVGGADPYDREPLWNNFHTSSEMYKYIQTVLSAKYKALSFNKVQFTNFRRIHLNSNIQTESYADQEIYAFFRGKMWVSVTNKFYQVTKIITTHPFQNGDVICNVFWPKDDCITVQNKSFQVYLNNGEAKIYLLKSQIVDIQEN
ncbi:hypothetical protein IMG5_188020 [Ichthyophthirius multifiliis]|uniref:alpha-amylase n=1 Tax=Ichthyophthirius multifiliis TaxID=5932 RepID=G0R3X2_ICHMU|nr:hypothetical protein IMG5_188020 [Ichthyophthirius multifiliis]EGR27831.1 hypothetical protein IMG5_188020 [Ichthyophthirius multifiliis]|eukprot:XP_004027176.1 hypothetical protein IMG5_188020 [Ichthyophthirius multifiliis]